MDEFRQIIRQTLDSGWAAVRAELKKLRADLAALTPAGKHKPTLERLKAKLSALESGLEAKCED